MELEYDNDLGSPELGEQREWDPALAGKSPKPRPPAEVCVCSFKDGKCCAGTGTLSRLWGANAMLPEDRLIQGKAGRWELCWGSSLAMPALAEGYGVTVKEVGAGSRLVGVKTVGQCATQGHQLVIILLFLPFPEDV